MDKGSDADVFDSFFIKGILRLAWEYVDKKDLATSMLVSQ